jgi:hypothetical protein
VWELPSEETFRKLLPDGLIILLAAVTEETRCKITMMIGDHGTWRMTLSITKVESSV